MSVLTDHEILRRIDSGDITVTPFDRKRVGPNSLDLMVEPRLLRVVGSGGKYGHAAAPLRMGDPTTTVPVDPAPDGYTLLHPNTLYLGSTVECVGCPADLVPYLDGRSSLGRLGVSVHVTAGRGDRGWRGQFTVEVGVVQPVWVRFDVPWCQLTFMTVEGDTAGGYCGRYMDQRGPTPSRI